MCNTKKYGKESYGYETLSDREKISNSMEAEIVDYLERNHTSIELIKTEEGNKDSEVVQQSMHTYLLNGDTELIFIGEAIHVLEHASGTAIFVSILDVVVENKVGIFASLRDYVKKQSDTK